MLKFIGTSLGETVSIPMSDEYIIDLDQAEDCEFNIPTSVIYSNGEVMADAEIIYMNCIGGISIGDKVGYNEKAYSGPTDPIKTVRCFFLRDGQIMVNYEGGGHDKLEILYRG